MRTGIDGLSLHVQQALGHAPCDGTAYMFANRRRTRLKVVCWDGTAVWMCLRRLLRGQFVWPQGRVKLADQRRAMAVAYRGSGLAAPVGALAGAVAAVRT